MDDYLKQLVEYMQNSQNQRKEESQVLSDTPQMGMPFTKTLKKQNPGIPESDISLYRNNVKDDFVDYIEGAGSNFGTINNGIKNSFKNIGVGIENTLQKLPEISRWRTLLDNPVIEKIREPLKRERNIQLMNKSEIENKALQELNRIPEMELPKVDEVTAQRNFKNWFDSNKAEKETLDLINSNKEIQDEAAKKASEFTKPIDDIEKTVPALSNEEILALLKKKAQ